MNKTYRTVWNRARHCFMAVGENVKSCGKASTKNVIAQAVAAAMLSLGAGQVMALACNPLTSAGNPNNISTTVGCQQLGTGASVNVQSGGTVGIAGASIGVGVGFGTVANSVANSGSIVGATAVFVQPTGTLSGGITNSGLIQGSNNGVSVRNHSAIGSITNNSGGTISGLAGGGISVLSNSTVNGGIQNSGVISGASGILIHNTSTVNGGITNLAGGTISGNVGISAYTVGNVTGGITNSGVIKGLTSGILLTKSSLTGGITNTGLISGGTNYGISLWSGEIVDFINNSGTITGGQVGIYLTGATINGGITNSGLIHGGKTGILISSTSTVSGGITNSGTISGIVSGASGSAIAITGHSTIDNIVNQAGGTITSHANSIGAGIFVKSSTVTGSIVNSGVISGASGIQITHGLVVGGITNNAGGTIMGLKGSGAGIGLWNSTLSGGITNSGVISGASGIHLFIGAKIVGSIANNAGGVITGLTNGIHVASGTTITGGITNSGTISGGFSSIYLSNSAVVGGVTNSGLLSGGLYLGGSTNLTNTGTVNIPLGGSGFVSGNYTQGAGGVLNLSVTSPGTFSNFNVVGTANFTGGNTIALKVDPAGTLVAGDVMHSVITTGTLTAPNGFVVQDNNLALNFTAAANGSNVDITTAATGLSSIASVMGPNSQLGSVLDNLLTQTGNGTLDPAIEKALFAIGGQGTAQGVVAAVGQLQPLLNGAVSAAMMDVMGNTNNAVQQRQDVSRGLSSGDDMVSNRDFWLKPFGSWANQDNDGTLTGYKSRASGIVVGVDTDKSPGTRLGVAFSYAKADVSSNKGGNQSAQIDSYQLIVYGSTDLKDRYYLDYQADYGWDTTHGKRNIPLAGSVAHSYYDSWNTHFGLGLGRTFDLADKETFTPSVRADYTYFENDGYGESGAGGLNQSVKDNYQDEFVVSLNGKYSKPLNATTTLVAELGLGDDLINKRNQITSVFAGAPSAGFTVNGIKSSSWRTHGGLGVVMDQSATMQVTVRYDVEARTGFINQTASVKARWAF